MLTNNVSYKPLVARNIFPNHHDCLPHPGVSSQHRFNLAQLNTKPTKLYLVIGAAEKLNSSVV
jgi:hypothetical protein